MGKLVSTVTTCSRRYRNANGANLGPDNFFIVFGFSQPSPDLDEIGFFKVKGNLVTTGTKEQTLGNSYSFFTILDAKGNLQTATDRPCVGDQ
uniref:Uncharacterized protein n=1 Tax=Solanum tuberosum TaxID=4113 RepID=M1D8I4_SOLTU